MRHLLNILELSTEEIDRLIATADDIMDAPEKYQNACSGKILATLFFEPSTRTRLSFESAMLGLGGKVLGFSDSSSSSAKKGESVADTIAVASAYADIIAMRHPKEGAPLVASLHSRVPIINGGDGGHYHPTQTLTDLLTIRHEKGRFDGLTVGLCGDLKFGRTVHSLIEALSRYAGVRFVLISPKELELLYFLASSPNQVFTREQLLDHIWGYEYIGDTRTVDVHIKRLREKIKDNENWALSTVWGIGYKFEVKR